MYRSILVPLDGSLASEQSLAYAAALSRRSGAALRLAYVHTPLILGEGTLYLGTPDVQLWEEEKKYLLTVVKRLQQRGLEKVSAQVLEGPIVETLHEQALHESCDLVVMTTHGRGPVSRFWLGSVADQLVHRLPIPLLLVRTQVEAPPPAVEPEIRNLLVALDGTPAAEQILEPVATLAKLLGATCTLLRVVPPAGDSAAAHETAVTTTQADALRAEAHIYLKRVATLLRDRGILVQTSILAYAHPAAAILNEAASGEYDLLALETHGRRGLPRLFLGSVADKVVRGAAVPVLVHRCLPS
ncbi:MAG TPA: universal stress protein [Gemmataceae bacterium]|nr:universal stress protein [Gemmataceae bacterium]